MIDTKPTNPKDAIGSKKLLMSLVPSSLMAYAATAFLEGALKYGRFNWRKAGVRSSIYKDALDRHVAKWWNGEDCDPETRVKHLASAIACLGILLDAELCGMLNDDRPPRAPVGQLIDEQQELVAHLQEMFKDHNPHQYTIADDEPPAFLFSDAITDEMLDRIRQPGEIVIVPHKSVGDRPFFTRFRPADLGVLKDGSDC